MIYHVAPVIVVAAGDDVTSTWPINQPAFGGYAKMKGTSMVRMHLRQTRSSRLRTAGFKECFAGGVPHDDNVTAGRIMSLVLSSFFFFFRKLPGGASAQLSVPAASILSSNNLIRYLTVWTVNGKSVLLLMDGQECCVCSLLSCAADTSF
jgi:hypothetical protein